MKFHESDPAIVYCYGIRQPDFETSQRLITEMRLANKYYNILVEIYRRAAEKIQDVRRKMFPDIAAAEQLETELVQSLTDVRLAIKNENSAQRKRTHKNSHHLVEKANEIKDDLKIVEKELKILRKAASKKEKLKKAWAKIEDEKRAEIKKARSERECSWGTGGEIEMSVEQAAKKSFGMPRFRKWDGGGKFVVQIQGGMSIDELFSNKDSRLRMSHNPYLHESRVPRSKRLTDCKLRIGSTESRDPIWVDVETIFHRPLPVEASIKRVYITLNVVGYHPIWKIGFVISNPAGWSKNDYAETGTVGIDVGWRKMDTGLRAAYWAGDDGDEGIVMMPDSWLNEWADIRQKISDRDLEFNKAQERLAKWLKSSRNLPNWLSERTETIAAWRSPYRLWRLIRDWRENRFDGDSVIFEWMLSWWKNERQITNSLEGRRRRLIHQRNEVYQQFAVMIRKKYRVANIEAINWAVMQKNAEPEEPQLDDAVKFNARYAAVGRLLEYLRQHVFKCVGIAPEFTTMQCFNCGTISEFDRKELVRECPTCGNLHDQDRNAALNLLNAASTEVLTDQK